MSTTQTVEIRESTMVVARVFRRVPGVTYAPAAGHFLLDVAATVRVDRGWTAENGPTGWTFAEPPPVEEPPPSMTAQERLAMAEARLAEAQDEINAAKAVLG